MYSTVHNFAWVDGIDVGNPGFYYNRNGTVLQGIMWGYGQPDMSSTDKHCLMANMMNEILIFNDDCNTNHRPLCYLDTGS